MNTGEDKRQTSPTCANIRIHPELFSIDRKVSPYVQGRNSILSQAIKTLESVLLLVHPVQGNFRVPPNCTEYTSGVNRGKCRSPLPSQSNYVCNDFRTIPLSYIGVREVCSSSSQSSCTLQGPNGTGIPNTDYLLFVSASSRTRKLTIFLVLHHPHTIVIIIMSRHPFTLLRHLVWLCRQCCTF